MFGALGIITAFPYAPVLEEEDGLSLVTPPSILQKVGIGERRREVDVEHGVAWYEKLLGQDGRKPAMGHWKKHWSTFYTGKLRVSHS